MQKKICFVFFLGALAFVYSCKWAQRRSDYTYSLQKTVDVDFVLIPKGTLNSLPGDVDISQAQMEEGYFFSVDSFYMSKYEVSNLNYLEFLYYVGRSVDTSDVLVKDIRFFDNGGERYTASSWRKLLPDTLNWPITIYSGNYSEYYLRHTSFRNYPVVGVSYEQAIIYCKWLSYLYNTSKFKKYKKVEFTLPTKSEWCYVARTQHNNNFAWAGIGWEDDLKQNTKGNWPANFNVIPQSSIGTAKLRVETKNGIKETTLVGYVESTNRPRHISAGPAEVKSFVPNSYGIYNMAGNAEEMLLEKGKIKGGSWNDTGYYLQNNITQSYDSTNYTSAERGFRVVMHVLEK